VRDIAKLSDFYHVFTDSRGHNWRGQVERIFANARPFAQMSGSGRQWLYPDLEVIAAIRELSETAEPINRDVVNIKMQEAIRILLAIE
jgi:hypothetical protein